MGGCWLHSANWLFFCVVDLDKLNKVGKIGKAAERLLPARLVLSPDFVWCNMYFSAEGRIHEHRQHRKKFTQVLINVEKLSTWINKTVKCRHILQGVWPYPCCWLCMWRRTSIMAAGGKEKRKKVTATQEKKFLFALELTAFSKGTQGLRGFQWSM